MFRSIIDTLLALVIVAGIVAVPVTGYALWTSTVHDGSIPHDSLWQMLIGPKR